MTRCFGVVRASMLKDTMRKYLHAANMHAKDTHTLPSLEIGPLDIGLAGIRSARRARRSVRNKTKRDTCEGAK